VAPSPERNWPVGRSVILYPVVTLFPKPLDFQARAASERVLKNRAASDGVVHKSRDRLALALFMEMADHPGGKYLS
jgi:hypothetical protein